MPALNLSAIEFLAHPVASWDELLENAVERLQLLDQLEETEKKSIFTIIDMAISKKRLTDSLSLALNIAK